MKTWKKLIGFSLAIPVLMTALPVAALANNYTAEIDQALTRPAGIGVANINSIDIEQAIMQIQSQRGVLLEQQLQQQMEAVNARNNEIMRLNNQLQNLDPNSPEAQDIKRQIDILSNSQQMDMLRLQAMSNKRNEAFDVMSEFIKKMQDSRSSIIGNMR